MHAGKLKFCFGENSASLSTFLKWYNKEGIKFLNFQIFFNKKLSE